MLERAVRVIALSGQQGTHPILGGRKHQHVALRVELSPGRLDDSFLHHLSCPEIHRSGRGKVAIFGKIGPLVDVKSFDRFGNNEVQVGIALPVRMGAQVNRHSIDKERHIGSVIRVESA